MKTMLTALALTVALPALATEWPDLAAPPNGLSGGNRDAAVIVGVENYTYLPDVPGAAQNAADWYRFLTAKGVPGHKIRLLVDPIRDADGRTPTDDPQGTNDGVLAAARQAAADVEPGGTLWFVFIGHGAPAQTGDDGLLVGVDASGTARGIYSRSVSRSKVIEALAEGRQGNTVAILDTCFSGRSPSGNALVADLQPVIPVAMSIGASATVLTATSAGQFAGPLPGGGRPAFSYLTLGALYGWGDADHNGSVTAQEAVTYARNALLTVVTDRQQEPQLEGGDGALALSNGRAQGPDLNAMRLASVTGPRNNNNNNRTNPTGNPLGNFTIDSDVTRMLAEQQCERTAYDDAGRQQRDALATAQETERTSITSQWSTLAEQAEACAQLDDNAMRQRCKDQVTAFEDALDGRQVTVPAAAIDVETTCGVKRVAAAELAEPSQAAASTLLEVQALIRRYDAQNRLGSASGPSPQGQSNGALNVDGRARFRETLRAGFSGDPRAWSVPVGGAESALVRTSLLDLGPGCVGYVDGSAPSLTIDYTAGRVPLRFATCSDQDTTLLVRGPNGWSCDDDTGPGTNAEVRYDQATTGRYDVFVGAITPGNAYTGQVLVSELGSRVLCEGATDTATVLPPVTSGGSLRFDQPARNTYALTAGFSPDPREFPGVAGGVTGSAVEASGLGLGEGCRGIVDPSKPDFAFDYTNGTYPLRFAFCASEDTSLVIRDPQGRWHCDDDDGPGLNPDVVVEGPGRGQYDVWLGSVNGTSHLGNLYVSERRDAVLCSGSSGAGSTTPTQAAVSGGRPNVSGDPRYGSVSLNAGFSPDPQRVAVRAGGTSDVRTMNLDSSCRGFIATDRPDYRVRYQAGTYALRIAACSGDDTTLVINDASGNWHCSDDAEGRNPVVTWTSPPSGSYDVWVGRYNSGEGDAQVVLSETSGPFCE